MANLTVLIPTYNRAVFLERALHSLTQQTYKQFQVIVTDNCSIDNTDNVIEKFKSELNITYLKSKTNLGAIRNWEIGLLATKTKWVKILWSDDWLEPEALELLLVFVEKQKLDIGICGAYGHLTQGIEMWVSKPFIDLKWPDLVPKLVLGELTASASCAIVKTEDALEGLKSNLLDQLAYSTAIGPDLLLMYWSVINGGSAGYIDKPLVNMFASKDSISILLGEKLRPLYAHSIIIASKIANFKIEEHELKILNHWIKEGVVLRRIPRLKNTPGKFSFSLAIRSWPMRIIYLITRKIKLRIIKACPFK